MATLKEDLRSLRFRLAREGGMLAYQSQSLTKMTLDNVFTDEAIEAMVTDQPKDTESLARACKFSAGKVEKYADQLLTVIASHTKRDAADADAELPSPKRPALIEASKDEISADDLSEEQKRWAEAAFGGESLFITGEAGTGKSFLLSYIVQEMRKTKVVAVTATTGIAAAGLGGVTINSFAGIGLGKDSTEKILAVVQKSLDACLRWRETDILVLDEISMMDADLFTLLEVVARVVRGNTSPFGGLQLLVCGDFLQLPPVSTGGFAFESPAWANSKLRTAELLTPHRQQGDKQFLAFLSEVRVGICSASTARSLETCSTVTKPLPSDGIPPTRLYCTNRDVEAENEARLRELDAEVVEVTAVDTWKERCKERQMQQMMDLMEKQAPATLRLKLGAQVIVTKNLPALGLVNGSRGVIEGWSDKRVFGLRCPKVRFDNGRVQLLEPERFTQSSAGTGSLRRLQLPLKLGWALTVHRAQGCTLSRAELLLEDAFAHGQVYVGLSRVKSLDGLWIKGRAPTQKEVRAHKTVLSFYFNGGG